MGGSGLPCGCSFTVSMFGQGLMSMAHCSTHAHLFSADKTLNQMFDEVKALHETVGERVT